MFNQETCKRCGTCLNLCPFLEMPKKEAREEIKKMIETGESEIILKNCAGCAYCNIICPTHSNPSHLRREILSKKRSGKGTACLSLFTEEVPFNMMSIGLEYDPEEQKKDLKAYLNPAPGKEVFYLGCALSSIYTDLAKTKLLERLPKVGGLKYCCGAYVNNLFGKEEAQIKGRQLLKELKQIGIERIVTFCPGCDRMISGVYPEILPEFDIKTINIVDYLI